MVKSLVYSITFHTVMILLTVLSLPLRSRNISARLREHHWLPLKSRMIFKFLITIFKCLNNMAPQQLTDKLSLICPLNMVLDDNTFRPKSAHGRRSFTYLAPRYWNATPRDLRIIPEIGLFKKELKFYLFDNTDDFLHRVHPYTTYSISQPGRINQFTTERLTESSNSSGGGSIRKVRETGRGWWSIFC